MIAAWSNVAMILKATNFRVLAVLFALCLASSATARNPTSVPSVVYIRETFGAVGDGIADDTDAVAAFLKACLQSSCHAERGRYRVTNRLPVISDSIVLRGDGIDTTEFIRDYDEEFGRGFFHFEGAKSGRGSTLSDFSIHSAKDRSGGHAIAGVSHPGSVFGNTHIEHVKLSTEGTDSWHATVYISGADNTSGAKGAREVSFASCLIFGAKGYSLLLESVVGFSFVGGGTYAAGGLDPHSGGVKIAGSKDVKSSGVLLIGDHFGYLNLRHALGVKVISASGLAGAQIDGRQVAIDADDSVDRVQISAEPFGAILTSWTNSSIVLPDGQIMKSEQEPKRAAAAPAVPSPYKIFFLAIAGDGV